MGVPGRQHALILTDQVIDQRTRQEIERRVQPREAA